MRCLLDHSSQSNGIFCSFRIYNRVWQYRIYDDDTLLLLLYVYLPPVDMGNFSLHRITRVNNTLPEIVISNGIYRNVRTAGRV